MSLQKEQTKSNKLNHQFHLLEKYCTSNVCFQNKTPDQQMSDFFTENSKIISSGKQQKTEETLYIAASNILLMATNAGNSAGNKAVATHGVEYHSDEILNSIDRKWRIKQKYNAAKKVEKILTKTRFLTISIIALGIICLIFAAYFDAKYKNLTAEANRPLQLNLWENIQSMFGTTPDRVIVKNDLSTAANAEALHVSTALKCAFILLGVAIINMIMRIFCKRQIDIAESRMLDYNELSVIFCKAERARAEEKELWDLK